MEPKNKTRPRKESKPCPFTLTRCRVIYGDTDKMGVAYYANYLRWFEIGRSEMFRFLKLSYKEIEKKGIFLPVADVACKFISPARYDDVLSIETRVDPTFKAGIKFNYRIWLDDDRGLSAKGHTTHACVNSRGKVTRPPEFIKEMVKMAAK